MELLCPLQRVCVCVWEERQWEKETEHNRAINCQEYNNGGSSCVHVSKVSLRTGGWNPANRKAAPPTQGSRPSQTGSAIKHKARRLEPPSDYDIKQAWGPLRTSRTFSHLPWALCLLTVWLTLQATCRKRAPHVPQQVQEAGCTTVSEEWKKALYQDAL